MKKLLVCLVAVFSLFVAYPVAAADGERIRSFDSAVTITRDSKAHIRETIVYDFGANEKHGIYRDIPIDYKDGDINYYVTAEFGTAVNENNQAIQTETDEVDGNLRVRIGDENETVRGVRTYILTYTLTPIVMQKDSKPFLNLDVLGEGWQVPVDKFSANVMLEGGSEMSTIAWYGAVSSSGASGTSSMATAQNISPYQAVTINAFLPANYTSNFLEPNKQRPADVQKSMWIFGIITVVVAIVTVIILVLTLRWWHAHRQRRAQTVIPEYEPPKGMTPADVGLLDDDQSTMREVTATVIDWAVHGYLKITQDEAKGWFGSRTYTLTKLKAGSGLPQHENALFETFFIKGDSVKLNDLDKTKMNSAVEKFKKAVKKKLSDSGWYNEKGNFIQKGNLTAAGAKQWAKVEGFQLYLSVVEKDRLKFSDAPDKTPERFNAMLPYAIALGVEKQWAKQFEGIDISQEVTWYSGNVAVLSTVSLANDLGTSFASTVSSNASFSSSGGSAGGGAGGGGGGSW